MPSRAGRALTAIRPLVAGAPGNLPVAMMVSGASVLNIECPVLRLSERACSIGEAIEPSRQTKAAVEKCRDCRPVRFAEGAMRYGDSAAIVRPTIAMRRGAILADGRDEG